MKIDLKHLMLGALLCLATACRNDPPPVLSIICLGDGFGGADCTYPDNKRVILLPSQLKNYWMTTNADAQNLLSWCYKTAPANVKANMEKLEIAIRGN